MSSGYLVPVKLEESTITFSFQNSLFEKKTQSFHKKKPGFYEKTT